MRFETGQRKPNDLRNKDHATEAGACAVRALWVAMAACAALGSAVAQAKTPAKVAKGVTVAQEQFICSLPGVPDRLIGIYRAPDGPQRCRVDYTREGKTRSLWSAGHDYAYCVRKALEIVALLEQVRFKCTPQTREAPGSAPIG
jgi:hypothetical protein